MNIHAYTLSGMSPHPAHALQLIWSR